jgi:hypothetical protein
VSSATPLDCRTGGTRCSVIVVVIVPSRPERALDGHGTLGFGLKEWPL